MFASAGRALAMLFDRRFLGLIAATLALTAVLFVALLIGIEFVLAHLPPLGSIWINRLLELLAPVLLGLAVFSLGAPVAAIVGSLFLDRIAAQVDKQFYPADRPAPGVGLKAGLVEALQLIGLALLLNVVLLPIDIGLPGIAQIATLAVNGWLLGREFFDLAALRHLSPADATALRRRYAGAVFAGGVLIALISLVPVADLVAPFFGAALMAHLFKELSRRNARPV